MSLHEQRDGILKTQITWADLEKHLQKALKTSATLGPSKNVVDIGEENGFASRCGLVLCDWTGAEKDEKLPETVVLKIPSALPMKKMGVMQGDAAMWEGYDKKLRELHNIEIAAYNFLGEFEGLPIPRMYYGEAFTEEDKLNGQICIEFVENSRVMNFYVEHTVEQLKQIARALGKIHACSLKKEITAPELKTNMLADFAKTVSLEAFRGMFKALLSLDSSEETKNLLERIEEILPEYYGSTLSSTIHKQMGLRPVLVNGDLRTENVLINNDTGDLASLIDWQCAYSGVGVTDLLRISLFALSAKERRESASLLVEEMHTSMVANLGGGEPPYSLVTLQSLNAILLPHSATYFAAGGIVIIAKQEANAKLSMEEKEKRKPVQMDKVIGALEDILVYHRKNRELVKELKFKDQ